MRIFAAVCLALFAVPFQQAGAEIIFHDNFDQQPLWSSKQRTQGRGGVGWGTSTYRGLCSANCPPSGWTSYRAAPSLWSPNERDTYLINSDGARGGSGKGLTYNVECSGQWGRWSGGSLDKYLGAAGYPELYVRFWLRESAGFCWGSEDLNLNALGKLLRISALRRDPTRNPRLFNPQRYPSPDTSPTLIGTAYRRFQPQYGIPAQFGVAERYAPDYGKGDNTTFPATLPNDSSTGGKGYCGDDKWHSYEYYVKLNSAPGAADGMYRVWLDGELVAGKEGIPWIAAGTDKNGTAMTAATGWNWVMLADNVDATSHRKEARVEMPRYIDDVVISTHYSGPPPPPVKLAVSDRSNSSIKLKWKAGENGARYALDSYHIYYGKEKENLSARVDVGNVTEYEVKSLESHTRYFFAVSASGKQRVDTNRNESPRSAVVKETTAR